MYQLIAKSGLSKGARWPIGPRALVLGRGRQCDITIADPTVSRRHCEITFSGGRLQVSDLGSSNTTLLNGTPVSRGVLRPGDEISVGSAVFVIEEVDARKPEPLSPEAKTMSLSEAEIAYLGSSFSAEAIEGRPQTLHEMFELLAFSRNLSRARSTAEIVKTMADLLIRRLKPRALWIARAGADLESMPPCALSQSLPGAGLERPESIMRQSLQEGRGLLVPRVERDANRREIVCVMAAPLQVLGESVGVVAVATGPPQGMYDERDLEFFVAATHTAAPFVHCMDTLDQLRSDYRRLRKRAGESSMLVGESAAIHQIREWIEMAARSTLPVLILGETGAGKELVARMIHDASPRASGRFVVINCAAIPRELFESEIFGYEKGAFTGASAAKVGRLEQANGGSVFLDEVGDLSPDNQARILRAIEQGSFHRVGAVKETRVDIRVISATNKDVANPAVFREDLYHRLNAFEIRIPPLRERREDIPVLAQHFFDLFRDQAKRPLKGISREALDELTRQPWPGNVRELRARINRAIFIAEDEWLRPEDVRRQTTINLAGEEPDAELSLAEVERRHILRTLQRHENNLSAAARVLGISRNTLYHKIAQYEIVI